MCVGKPGGNCVLTDSLGLILIALGSAFVPGCPPLLDTIQPPGNLSPPPASHVDPNIAPIRLASSPSEIPPPPNTGEAFTPDLTITAGTTVINRWSKSIIRYRIVGIPASADSVTIRAIVSEAAARWSLLIPLEIEEAELGEQSDITIQICSAPDGPQQCQDLVVDGVQFNGRAEFPRNDGPIMQTILLPDSLEDLGQQSMLLCVVVHEFGHNLGLGHSDVAEAIMFPFKVETEFTDGGCELHPDDIRRIQLAYGDRSGTMQPVLPLFPKMPSDPDFRPELVGAEGPDRDGDGIPDLVEEIVTATNPAASDTDGDGLSDAFEITFGLNANDADSDGDGRLDRDEVVAGTAARAPIICNAPLEFDGQNVVFLSDEKLRDAMLVVGQTISIENTRTGCTVSGITVLRCDDCLGSENGFFAPSCTVRLPRALRSALCIFQLHVAVPLLFCQEGTGDVLFDFETGFLPPVVIGGTTDLVMRHGSGTLEFRWSLADTADDAFAVLLFRGRAVGPCDAVLVDIETDKSTILRVELKSTDARIRDVQALLLAPGAPQTVEIRVTSRYAAGEIAFVIERDLSTRESAGVIWIDNVRLTGDG